MHTYVHNMHIYVVFEWQVRTYYELRFPGRRAFDEEGILSELSAPLMHEVRLPTSTYTCSCMHTNMPMYIL